MSNRVYFNLTKFVDLGFNAEGDLVEEDADYGYRIFDDYGKTYNNFLTEEEAKKISVEEALKIITETAHSEDPNGDFTISVEEHGFYFNGDWIDWYEEENRELFSKFFEYSEQVG
jgi:hypothetical protein